MLAVAIPIVITSKSTSSKPICNLEPQPATVINNDDQAMPKRTHQRCQASIFTTASVMTSTTYSAVTDCRMC